MKEKRRVFLKLNSIRVLLVAALPPPLGGDSTWAEEYLKYSEEKKYFVKVVNTSVIGIRSQNVNDSFVIVDEIKRALRIWKGIWKAIKQDKPDVVHMNSNCSPKGLPRDYISSLIVKIKKVPLIIHCHTNVGFKLKRSLIGRFFLKRFLSNAQTIIVLNDNSYNYVVNRVKSTTVIIPNFINNDYIIQEDRKINNEIRNVVFIGHVRREKGIEEVLAVASQFEEITFHIVGPITEHYYDYIPKTNVRLRGAVSSQEVQKYLMDCDLFLFPTYSEGFSIALLEAMASGIPIIATNVGANKNMIEKNGGVIVEPMNIDSIIEAINKLQDKEVRQNISSWNINKVKNFYSINIVMDQLRQLYFNLVDCAEK